MGVDKTKLIEAARTEARAIQEELNRCGGHADGTPYVDPRATRLLALADALEAAPRIFVTNRDLGVMAQRFYETSGLFISHTAKADVVRGLEAALEVISNSVDLVDPTSKPAAEAEQAARLLNAEAARWEAEYEALTIEHGEGGARQERALWLAGSVKLQLRANEILKAER